MKSVVKTGMLVFIFPWAAITSVSAANVDYVRDVKPILKRHCYRCHGATKSKSNLRLDTAAFAVKGGQSGASLIPGNAAKSVLVQRITGDDDSRMPPVGDRVSDEEIETIKRWIAAGAKYPNDESPDDPRAHWSFQRIQRPKPPRVSDDWSRNPIDVWIARKHIQHGLSARPLASRQTILRRVYLDLIGLPPSRKQLRAFLADESPDAYLKVVDELLASPHYGERWGRHWLDVWRYSDWYGFQSEVRFSQKNIWHWRDWVVESLNDDKGYDRMVTEMLAGDEIVPFDASNLRATGFLVRNRNTDSREQWIRDTVEHSAKAFLGLTIGCVQCHDHPNDPIWHDEYYRYRNIFEPVQVNIDSGGGGPAGKDLAGVARIFDRNINAATKFYIRGNDRTPDEKRKITPGVPQVFFPWSEPKVVKLPPSARIPHLRKAVHEQTLARLKYNVDQSKQSVTSAKQFLEDTQARMSKIPVDDSKRPQDALLTDSFERQRTDTWQLGRGNWVYSDGHLNQDLTGEQRDCWIQWIQTPPQDFSIRVRFGIKAGGADNGVGVLFNYDPDAGRGEGVLLSANVEKSGLQFFFEYGDERHFRDNLRRELPIRFGEEFDLRIVVRDQLINVFINDAFQQSFEMSTAGPGRLRLMTIDATAEFHDVRIDALPDDAALAPANVVSLFAPTATIDRSHVMHLNLARGVVDQSQLQTTVDASELASYEATWTADSWRLLNAPDKSDETATLKHKQRHEELGKKAQATQRQLSLAKAMIAHFKGTHEKKAAINRAKVGDAEDETLKKTVETATKKLETQKKQLDSAKAALEMPATAKYQGLPGSYGSSSGRRLALAKWVVDDRNPLTARVAVNHIWLRHFGQALVPSVFDFGRNGKKPSQPELLDWLASELQHPSMVAATEGSSIHWVDGLPIHKLWSMKHLHRLIVTSRVYRLDSSSDPGDLKRDPDNRWFWRMTRRRMNAETVRDSLLAATGQLDTTLGGPDLTNSDGMSVFRRSLYFHQAPNNQMEFLKLFDVADPTESYQRHTSIVPHQALALLNSRLSIEQSRRLARRLSKELETDEEFITAAYETVLSRAPRAKERLLCREFLQARTTLYEKQTGDPIRSEEISRSSSFPKVHARENLVHSLFNHHEFVTIK